MNSYSIPMMSNYRFGTLGLVNGRIKHFASRFQTAVTEYITFTCTLISIFTFLVALFSSQSVAGGDNEPLSSNDSTHHYDVANKTPTGFIPINTADVVESPEPDPSFFNQTIKLSDYIKQRCQTYHPALSQCQQAHSLSPLFSNTTPEKPSDTDVNPMTGDDIKLFNHRLATNKEISQFRKYLKAHQSIVINGAEQKVEKLSEKTPLLYQFFSISADSQIPPEYVATFRNNCKMEPDRKTLILTDSYYSNAHDRQILESLAAEFDHVELFDISQLPQALDIHGVKVIRSVLSDGQPTFEIQSDQYSKYYAMYWLYIDCARFFALYQCDQLFQGSSDDESQGCIFMDWDFFLTREIGEVYLPGGIACYIQDEFVPDYDSVIHSLTIENGLIAVSNAHHRVLENVFTRPLNTPYMSFVTAISNFFSEASKTEHRQVNVGCSIEVTPEDFIPRGYLSAFQRNYGQIREGEWIQWEDLKYDPGTAWRQMIAFPVSECMVPDVSRFLGISTWQAHTTDEPTPQPLAHDEGSDQDVFTNITQPEQPHSPSTSNLKFSSVFAQINQLEDSHSYQNIPSRPHNPDRLAAVNEKDSVAIDADSHHAKETGLIRPPLLTASTARHRFSLHCSIETGRGNWTKNNPVICARSISFNNFQVAKAIKSLGENELSILTELKQGMHENIANLLDTAKNNKGEEFVILQHGGDKLTDRMQHRKMSQQSINHCIAQLVDAVIYLHSLGIVHRDLNPDNILFNEGFIKVCDFGLSLRENQALSEAVPLCYAPIEAYLGINDSSYDFWSIGCLLYELACGRRLFSAEVIRPVAYAAIQARTHHTPFHLDDTNPHYTQLSEIIKKAQKEISRKAGEPAADFFAQAMALDYRERLNAQQVEKHPYIQASESSLFQFHGTERSVSTATRTADTIEEVFTFDNNEFSRPSSPSLTVPNTDYSGEENTKKCVPHDTVYENTAYPLAQTNRYANLNPVPDQANKEREVIEIPIISGPSYDNPNYLLLQKDTRQINTKADATTVIKQGDRYDQTISFSLHCAPEELDLKTNQGMSPTENDRFVEIRQRALSLTNRLSTIQDMQWLPKSKKFYQKTRSPTPSEYSHILIGLKKALQLEKKKGHRSLSKKKSPTLPLSPKRSNPCVAHNKTHNEKTHLYYQENKDITGNVWGHRYFAQLGSQGLIEVDKTTFKQLNRQRLQQHKKAHEKHVRWDPALRKTEDGSKRNDKTTPHNPEVTTQPPTLLQPETAHNPLIERTDTPPKQRNALSLVCRTLKSMLLDSDDEFPVIKKRSTPNFLIFIRGWGAVANQAR